MRRKLSDIICLLLLLLAVVNLINPIPGDMYEQVMPSIFLCVILWFFIEVCPRLIKWVLGNTSDAATVGGALCLYVALVIATGNGGPDADQSTIMLLAYACVIGAVVVRLIVKRYIIRKHGQPLENKNGQNLLDE